MNRKYMSPRHRTALGATILEYVILAVGIGIFCTFGVLMFGRVISERTDEASAVLSGEQDANVAGNEEALERSGEASDDTGGRNNNMGGRD